MMKKIVLIFLSLFLSNQFICKGQVNKRTNGVIQPQIISEKIGMNEFRDLIKHKMDYKLDSLTSIKKIRNRYQFILQKNKALILQDNGKEDDLTYKKYLYLGSLNKTISLFSEDGYENNELFLLNLNRGTHYKLLSTPYINKNAKMFFTFSNNIEIDYFDNKIELYLIHKNNSIIKVKSFDYRESSPIEVFWVAKDELAIKILNYVEGKEILKYEKWKIKFDI